MRLKKLIPRSLVRIKNEVILTIRYRADARLRALTSSDLAGGSVTYVTSAGLANRMRSHYIAATIARRAGRRLVPIWMPTKELASDGHDLFASVMPRGGGAWRTPRRIAMTDLALATLPHVLAVHTDHLIVLDFDAQWVPIAEARRALSNTEPVAVHVRPNVIATADHIAAQIVKPALAVHVRQTDFITHTRAAKPMSHFTDKIAEALERRVGPPFRTLVVASDDRVMIDAQLASRFERVVTLTPTYSRRQPGVATEALAQLLVLARGDEFIGSPYSSFSELIVALRDHTVTIEAA